MKTLLVTLALLVVPTFAFAQHPCDTTPPANPSVQNPYKVQFCSDLTDLDGLAIPAASVQVRITIDGTAQALRSLPAAIGSASATGFNLYEVGSQTSTKGAHSVVVGLVTADGEGVSVPFAYSVRGKAPKSPTARVAQ